MKQVLFLSSLVLLPIYGSLLAGCGGGSGGGGAPPAPIQASEMSGADGVVSFPGTSDGFRLADEQGAAVDGVRANLVGAPDLSSGTVVAVDPQNRYSPTIYHATHFSTPDAVLRAAPANLSEVTLQGQLLRLDQLDLPAIGDYRRELNARESNCEALAIAGSVGDVADLVVLFLWRAKKLTPLGVAIELGKFALLKLIGLNEIPGSLSDPIGLNTKQKVIGAVLLTVTDQVCKSLERNYESTHPDVVAYVDNLNGHVIAVNSVGTVVPHGHLLVRVETTAGDPIEGASIVLDGVSAGETLGNGIRLLSDLFVQPPNTERSVHLSVSAPGYLATSGSTTIASYGLTTLLVVELQGSTPSLLTPGEGAQEASPVMFSWTAVSGAQNYVLRVDQVPGSMTSQIYMTSATSLSLPLGAGNYTWSVTAQGPFADSTSDVRSVVVSPSLPPPPPPPPPTPEPDINGDGLVNLQDYAVLLNVLAGISVDADHADYATHSAGNLTIRADVDKDGVVNAADRTYLETQHGFARIVPTQDAAVWEFQPSANYGGASFLSAGLEGGVGREWRTLLEFGDLSAIQGTLQEAVLHLNVTGKGGESTPALAVHAVTGSWNQASTTWSSQPAFAPSPAATTAVLGLGYRNAPPSITGLVSGWIASPGGNHGVAFLLQAGEPKIDLRSSENTLNPATNPALLVRFQ